MKSMLEAINMFSPWTGIFLSNLQGGIWDFGLFWQILDLLKKKWTFQYAAGFRGPGILIKRSTMLDLSVHHVAQRSRYLAKDPKKGLKNIQKSIAALSHLAATASRRLIAPRATYQILDLFGLSQFKGGAMPLNRRDDVKPPGHGRQPKYFLYSPRDNRPTK